MRSGSRPWAGAVLGYKPAVVLIGEEVREEWLGARSEDEMRVAIESLLGSQ